MGNLVMSTEGREDENGQGLFGNEDDEQDKQEAANIGTSERSKLIPAGWRPRRGRCHVGDHELFGMIEPLSGVHP